MLQKHCPLILFFENPFPSCKSLFGYVRLIIFLFFPGRSEGAAAGGTKAHPDFATLFQSEEQIMPSILMLGPRGFSSPPTFGPALGCEVHT